MAIRDHFDAGAVAGVAFGDYVRHQFELRVGQHAAQFVERAPFGQAGDVAGFQWRHDRHGIGVGPADAEVLENFTPLKCGLPPIGRGPRFPTE